MVYYYDNLIVLCVTLTMSLKCCVKHKGDISPAHKNILSVGCSESGRQRLFPFTSPSWRWHRAAGRARCFLPCVLFNLNKQTINHQQTKPQPFSCNYYYLKDKYTLLACRLSVTDHSLSSNDFQSSRVRAWKPIKCRAIGPISRWIYFHLCTKSAESTQEKQWSFAEV